MKKNSLALIGILAGAGLFVLYDSLFVVHQTAQAIVMQFGDPLRVIKESGLHFKMPLLQNVVFYDKRMLDLDPPSERLILADQKRIEVDTFTRFRITDPLTFYKTVTTETQARSRLGAIVTSTTRRVLGNATLPTLLSAERDVIMNQIRERVNLEAQALGVDVNDVRIRRADLPDETSQSIYARMKSEREREAREARAQGQELAQQIRSRADREKVVLLAEAQKKAQILRGEGEAEAFRIWAEANSRDIRFYDFYRALQFYRSSLGESTWVLSPNSDLLRYLRPLPAEDETSGRKKAPGS
ncbi:MAG: membrane protease subunit HflC [Rhodospirillaceae bacterium]|nr:MAG: membrane protease subunit HflC [Rhodospirillaceae bacterium]